MHQRDRPTLRHTGVHKARHSTYSPQVRERSEFKEMSTSNNSQLLPMPHNRRQCIDEHVNAHLHTSNNEREGWGLGAILKEA